MSKIIYAYVNIFSKRFVQGKHTIFEPVGPMREPLPSNTCAFRLLTACVISSFWRDVKWIDWWKNKTDNAIITVITAYQINGRTVITFVCLLGSFSIGRKTTPRTHLFDNNVIARLHFSVCIFINR